MFRSKFKDVSERLYFVPLKSKPVKVMVRVGNNAFPASGTHEGGLTYVEVPQDISLDDDVQLIDSDSFTSIYEDREDEEY
jgi:hypothetical protein